MKHYQLLKTSEGRQLWGIWGIIGIGAVSIILISNFNPFFIPFYLGTILISALLYLSTIKQGNNNPYITQPFTTNLYHRKYLTSNHCDKCGSIIEYNDNYCTCGKKIGRSKN